MVPNPDEEDAVEEKQPQVNTDELFAQKRERIDSIGDFEAETTFLFIRASNNKIEKEQSMYKERESMMSLGPDFDANF